MIPYLCSGHHLGVPLLPWRFFHFSYWISLIPHTVRDSPSSSAFHFGLCGRLDALMFSAFLNIYGCTGSYLAGADSHSKLARMHQPDPPGLRRNTTISLCAFGDRPIFFADGKTAHHDGDIHLLNGLSLTLLHSLHDESYIASCSLTFYSTHEPAPGVFCMLLQFRPPQPIFSHKKKKQADRI